MNCPYDELAGSETALSCASAAAWFRQPRYTRKPTYSVDATRCLKLAGLAQGGTLPWSVVRCEEVGDADAGINTAAMRAATNTPLNVRDAKNASQTGRDEYLAGRVRRQRLDDG